MLNREVASQSMKRIVCLYGFGAGETEVYLETVREACKHMEPFQFEQVCAEVASRTRDKQRPKPAVFRAIFDELAERFHWRESSQPLTIDEPRYASPEWIEKHSNCCLSPGSCRATLDIMERLQIKTMPESMVKLLLDRAGEGYIPKRDIATKTVFEGALPDFKDKESFRLEEIL